MSFLDSIIVYFVSPIISLLLIILFVCQWYRWTYSYADTSYYTANGWVRHCIFSARLWPLLDTRILASDPYAYCL